MRSPAAHVVTQPLPPVAPAGVPLRAPVHPGRFLEQHYLIPLSISQTRAAELLGISRRRVNEIIMGHRAMSPDTALRCALAFGTRADFWLALQSSWDCFQAWRELRTQVRDGLTTLPPAVVSDAAAPEAKTRRAARLLRQQARVLHRARSDAANSTAPFDDAACAAPLAPAA